MELAGSGEGAAAWEIRILTSGTRDVQSSVVRVLENPKGEFLPLCYLWGTSTNSYSYPLVVRHFSFCQHDLTFGTRNALSFLSLQCREKKEKESEPKLWPRGHIQPATIHQYTIVAHAHDCSSAGSPPSLIRIVDKARRAHIVMSLNWAHVRARDERKMGENNS